MWAVITQQLITNTLPHFRIGGTDTPNVDSAQAPSHGQIQIQIQEWAGGGAGRGGLPTPRPCPGTQPGSDSAPPAPRSWPDPPGMEARCPLPNAALRMSSPVLASL